MIRSIDCSWFCFCLCTLLCATVTSSQLPRCTKTRRAFDIPSVPACQQFVKLLENPHYCSLDQSQNCCVVLAAAVANHCHCWKGLSTTSLDLLKLLHQHCGDEPTEKASQNLDIKVFIGVLTGAAHAEQRQAGEKTLLHLLLCMGTGIIYVAWWLLQCGRLGAKEHRGTALPFSLQPLTMKPCLTLSACRFPVLFVTLACSTQSTAVLVTHRNDGLSVLFPFYLIHDLSCRCPVS